MSKAIRVYADASVYGGAFDEDFRVASLEFFRQIRAGRFQLVMSAAVGGELEDAPERVRSLFEEMRGIAQFAALSQEAARLQEAYLAAGIIGRKWETDMLHVALATESQCSMLVSWNFKHHVNFRKIPLYNGVNLANGYPPIAIYTPQEVVEDED